MGRFYCFNQVWSRTSHAVQDVTSALFPFPPPPVYAQVFNEADKDGDGNLTYTEFERVMYFYPEFYK